MQCGERLEGERLGAAGNLKIREELLKAEAAGVAVGMEHGEQVKGNFFKDKEGDTSL